MSKDTIEDQWHRESKEAEAEAEKLPHGSGRDALVRKARQLKTASQLKGWLSSPGLRTPT